VIDRRKPHKADISISFSLYIQRKQTIWVGCDRASCY